MKVIAVNDAPKSNGYYYKGKFVDKAYYKGDVFEVVDNKGWLVIKHDKLQTNMEVNLYNFQSLDEWRNEKINEILK